MTADRNRFRYLRFHAFDVAKSQVLLFALASFGLAYVTRKFVGESVSADDIADALRTLIGGTLFIAVLMATGGVAGTDIKQGYYRAFFSKPMAPWWYYLQRWLIGAVAVLSIPFWLTIGFQLAYGQSGGLTWSLFASIGLVYLLIGGAVLLLSTVTARDWLVVFLVYFLQGRLHDAETMLTQMGQAVPRSIELLLKVLPPFDKVTVGAALPTGWDLAHVLSYGGAMVFLALGIFAYRPLGSGGRA